MTNLSRLSIRIYGINYVPEETGIAPYTAGLAEYLSESGNLVTVVTGVPHYPSWQVPAEHRRSRTERVGSVEIHRRRHYVPRRPSAVRRGLYELTFFVNGSAARKLPEANIAIGVTPSLSGAMLAASWAKRHSKPYGLIIQDLMGLAAAESGTPGGTRVASTTAKLEAVALRHADAIGVIAEGFRPRLVDMGVDPSRVLRIRNWTHIQPSSLARTAARAKLGLPADAYIALHAGNIGIKQGLENVVAAAKLSAQAQYPVHFVFVGDGNQRPVIELLADGLPNVRFIPPLPDDDFPDALAAADVLLVNQRPTITDMCLPGKLTSYFAARRPVIAAVAPESETARELTAAEAGLVISAGDPQVMIEAIDHLREHPDLAAQLSERGAQFASEQLTPEASFVAIDAFVERLRFAKRHQATPIDLAMAQGD